jgi:hypothetical protein
MVYRSAHRCLLSIQSNRYLSNRENIHVITGTALLPGDIKLYDADPSNGSNPNPNQDRVLTSKMPGFGTVSLNMNYKRFDFSADFYTVQGVTKTILFYMITFLEVHYVGLKMV